MKKMFGLAVCAFLLAACDGKPAYTISGTIDQEAAEGQYVYLYMYSDKEAAPLDSALVTGGAFSFKGVQDTPLLVALRPAEGVIDSPQQIIYGGFDPYAPWFLLDNSNLKVSLGLNSAVEGSPENNELTAYYRLLDEIYDGQTELEAQLKSKNDSLINIGEAALEALDAQAISLHKAYILSHSNSLAGANVFYINRYALPEADQREIIAQAGDLFKSAPGIDKRIEHLAILEKVAIGKAFTDFEMSDPQGNPHKLSEYTGKGKVVLIDFWASWCPPCRRSMPYLREVYKQYKDKGFEIVGVSLDRTQEAWVKGIEDLQITWPQISDLQYWKSAGAALYGVNSIPHTVLLDKDGIILAKNLHGADLGAKLAEILE
ncbi:MAG: AhpC/TSA family protein [Tannerellaceae bacterium]|jgi:thiol-disulfide isomerase/thioredoxin|nr:AhpC/TSA family protein [Tannerellaceae bacterium]